MANKFFIDLGHVIDREGEKIAVSMQTEQWGDETVYGVAFNELNNPNELFAFGTLFDFVLRDGLRDFEIFSETMSTIPTCIPAGEIRALVRRILGPHEFEKQVFTVYWNSSVLRQHWRLVPVGECPF